MRLNYEQSVELKERGLPFNSPKAGGCFVLKQSGAPLLDSLTCRQRVNLSYWIYRHNYPSYLLFGASPDQGVEPPVLDEEWVVNHRDCTPSIPDRILTLLCELIRANNAGERPNSILRLPAGGCQNNYDLSELFHHTAAQGWTTTPGTGMVPFTISLSGRMYVEEQLGERGGDQRGENQQAVVPDPAKLFEGYEFPPSRALRRISRSTGLANESEFLNREFTISNIRNLPIDAQVVPIIEKRLDEARRALGADAHLSVIFLCGSVLEGVLFGAAKQNPENFNKAKATPRAADGSPRRFREWSLADLIDVACEIEVLKPDVKEFSHRLRDFRNYIHPYQQMTSGFPPDKHTARICFQVLKAALASLAGER